MGKIYNNGNVASYYFNSISATPIDSRSVVDSYLSLFQKSTWDVNNVQRTYSGMPVVVSSASSMSDEMNEDTGVYILVRAIALDHTSQLMYGYEYIYDPDAAYSSVQEENKYVPPTKDGDTVTVPGRSNLCGWMKIVSFKDLKFPTPEEPTEYVLKVYPNGSFEWVEHTGDGSGIEPGDTANTVLTTVWDENDQEFKISWEPIPQQEVDLKLPDLPNRYVLKMVDPTDPDGGWYWEPEGEPAPGIDIKNFVTEFYPDGDQRQVIPSNGDLTRKRILSNSGEVIAVDEIPEDNTEQGPDRPFRLMLNYDAIPPLVINGGDSTWDPETGVLVVYYMCEGTEVYRVQASYPVSSDTQYYTAMPSIVVNGTEYETVQADLAPKSFVMTSAGASLTIDVDALPAWNPVVKYAMQPMSGGNAFVGYDWSSTGTSSSPTVLTETAPKLTTEETPANGFKYFYGPDGSLPITQVAFNTLRGRIRITDTNWTTDLVEISMWDSSNEVWTVINEETDPKLYKQHITVASGAPSTDEWDIRAEKAGSNPITPLYLTLRLKIRKS